jgi:hypothetical protein
MNFLSNQKPLSAKAGLLLFPNKRGICVQITANESCKKHCLHIGDESYIDFFINERMSNLVFFPLLVCDKKLLSGFIVHHNGTTLHFSETFAVDALQIYQ